MQSCRTCLRTDTAVEKADEDTAMFVLGSMRRQKERLDGTGGGVCAEGRSPKPHDVAGECAQTIRFVDMLIGGIRIFVFLRGRDSPHVGED